MAGPLSNLAPNPESKDGPFVGATISFDEEGLAWVDREAERLKRNRSEIIRHLIRSAREASA